MMENFFSRDFMHGAYQLNIKTNTEKKARLFQTFMSDAELSDRNIVITESFANDEINNNLVKGLEGVSSNVPILHAVHYSKFKSVITKPEVKAERPSSRKHLAFTERLASLRSAANEEGIPLSEDSIVSGMRLLQNLDFNVKPSLYLSANGNLRIVWSNKLGEQVALQVKGNKDEIQYVIFIKNEKSKMEQILGFMSSSSFIKLVKYLDVQRILFDQEAIHAIFNG